MNNGLCKKKNRAYQKKNWEYQNRNWLCKNTRVSFKNMTGLYNGTLQKLNGPGFFLPTPTSFNKQSSYFDTKSAGL
jgi:hypothetical protein